MLLEVDAEVGGSEPRALTHADRDEIAASDEPVKSRLRDSEQLADVLNPKPRLEGGGRPV
jgi:hypothetical protein